MPSVQYFYDKYITYSKEVIDDVIKNAPDDATMFSADCIQKELFWKFDNGRLMHSGLSTRNWYDSGFTSLEAAKKSGVRDIYDLNQLIKIVNDKGVK